MCLLALYYRAVEDAPVVVGANREEEYRRDGLPPQLLRTTGGDHTARAVFGTDPTAGGTWLGVNEHGVFVAVTNRAQSHPPPRPRSRGLLTRELLALPTAREVAAFAVQELERGVYAGCNFVCADAASATVVHAGDWLRVRPLPPGLHVLTNRDVNDASDPRASHVLAWLGGQNPQSADDCLNALRRVRTHHPPENPPICVRLEKGGTLSSTVLALRPSLAASSLWHAQGPPDRTPYADLSHLLRELAGPLGARAATMS